MATSGSKSVSVASGLTLKFNWSQSSQSVSNNTTTISWNMQVILASGHTISSSASKDWSVTVNGKTYSGSNSFGSMGSGATKTMASGSTTIAHNSDGTKTFNYSFSQQFNITFNGASVKTGSGSGSGTLNTIARASSFTLSSSSLDMGGSQTVNITRASSSFTHTVQYTFGGTTITPYTKTTSTSVSFTPSLDLANKIPNATSGTCTVKVTTYNGDTAIGSSSKTFTLKVPSSVKPNVSLGVTYNSTLSGLCLAGKSTVKVTPTGTGSYSSTISSYSYSGAGLSGTGSSKTTGTLSAGSYTITVTVTDSRGRTNSASTSFTVHAYSNPWVTASVYRCDSNGNANASGTYARIKASWGISNPNSANANLKQYKIEWKKSTATSWNTYKDWANLPTYSASNTVIDCGKDWANTTSYDVRLSVKDSYSTATSSSKITTISCIFNAEKGGIGVGKIYERGALDVGGAVYSSDRFIANANGKNVIVGTGTSDVYLHNSASGKYLQLKDNGTLSYSDATILTGTYSSSGNRWGITTTVSSDGVMEVGKYIDFHESDGDTSDYSVRLTSSNNQLWTSSGVFNINGGNCKVGYYGTDACAYISNANGNWLRLTDDGNITWKGKNVFYDNCTGSFDHLGQYFTIGDYNDKFNAVQMKRYSSAQGNMLTKLGTSIAYESPCARLEIGKVDSSGNLTVLKAYTFGNEYFSVHTNNAVNIGSGTYRFKAVYATNGTIQTSDGRYKYILEDVNSQTCYDLIKDMNLYGYSTLNKRIDEYVDTTEISDELQQSSQEDMNLHMGFVAQEIEDSELAKYILIKDELEDEDGNKTGEHIYSVDNYAYTTAIHGALIHEIELRDVQIEEKDKQIEELQDKVNELQSKNEELEQRLAKIETLLNA